MSRAHPLLRDDSGAVAIEMALVGPPFIVMLLAVVEMALTLITQSVLDGATRDAVRLLRSGQIAAAGAPDRQAALFRSALCHGLGTLLIRQGCDSNLVFSVAPLGRSGGGSAAPLPQCLPSGASGAACPFDLGGGGQIIAVEVQYWRPYIVPWIGGCLSGTGCGAAAASAPAPSPGTARQISVAVFMN